MCERDGGDVELRASGSKSELSMTNESFLFFYEVTLTTQFCTFRAIFHDGQKKKTKS